LTVAPSRPLPNLRSQPLRKTGRPGAAGVRDNRLLELGQVPEHTEAALDGRDERLGLDAVGGPKQALQVGPVVLAAAELLEQRVGKIKSRILCNWQSAGSPRIV
jgi:hypothetical protein